MTYSEYEVFGVMTSRPREPKPILTPPLLVCCDCKKRPAIRNCSRCDECENCERKRLQELNDRYGEFKNFENQ